MTQRRPERSNPRRNLNPTERRAVLARMYSAATKLRLPAGLSAELAAEYDCSERSLSRLWATARAKLKAGTIHDGESGRRGRRGRKGRLSDEFAETLANTIALLPLHERTNLRTLADRLGIPKSSLHIYYQSGLFRSHHARLKPHLTDENRAAPVKFALSFTRPGPGGSVTIDPMLDVVHLDEKWFFLKKDNTRYYLAPDEEAPPHHSQTQELHGEGDVPRGHRAAAMGRPQEENRKSKNRDAGTLELKSYTVDREIYRTCLARSVIPTIKRLWPSGKRVRIQQDNAKPHVLSDDAVVSAACTSDGWDMALAAQPANSPDFNVLDLGFFASLQTLQHRKPARNIEQLVDSVDDAFRELSYQTIDGVFMTLQTVVEASMKAEGGNRYSIPHRNKQALVGDSGLLPFVVSCDQQVYKNTLKAQGEEVRDAQNTDG